MSETLRRTRWQTINATPLRDLLRGRVTARLDWRGRLAAAGLSADVASLVTRVVRRTRLWRLEKAAVADELIAHFADAIAAGALPADAVADFGDERAAAELIRRAKRRGRPIVWHLWIWACRATAGAMVVALLAHGVLAVLYVTGRPTPVVDYAAELTAPARAVPVGQRAWPLWVAAAKEAGAQPDDPWGSLPAPLKLDPDGPRWPEVAAWVRGHAGVAEQCRRAAAMPGLGFVPGPDPDAPAAVVGSVMGLAWRSGQILDVTSGLLSVDAKLAGEVGDGGRAAADLEALLAEADQIRGDGEGRDGLGCDWDAAARLAHLLADHPTLLSDAQLTRLAHRLAGPQVAADLLSMRANRLLVADILQRTYTDGGRGHLTRDGVAFASAMRWMEGPSTSPLALSALGRWGAPAAVVMVQSGAELSSRFEARTAEIEAAWRRPARDVDWDALARRDQEWQPPALPRELSLTTVTSLYYAVAASLEQAYDRSQPGVEMYLGQRDGVEVAIALEVYRRRHAGRYPATLAELTPDPLPAVPADRITGDPLRYRLVGGKPLVYSVGSNRVDDGGRTPAECGRPSQSTLRPNSAARWGVPVEDAVPGDWVLYPLPTEAE